MRRLFWERLSCATLSHVVPCFARYKTRLTYNGVKCAEAAVKRIPVSIIRSADYINTANPLYTDTRYNDQIRYNDNLNVTKPSLRR